MSWIADVLTAFSFHRPSVAMPVLIGAVPFAWRPAGPPERAAILSLSGMIVIGLALSLFDWAAAFQSAADILALSWMVPVALRANRVYPAVISASLLIAVLVQLLALMPTGLNPVAIEMVIASAHLTAIVSLGCGILFHRRRSARAGPIPAWRDQLHFE